jgi:hypothetical protein
MPAEVRREWKRRLFGYPRICPQIYAWAKQNPEHVEIVREFFGPHRRRRNPPQAFSSQEIPSAFADHLEYPLYEKTLFCIKCASIQGEEGVVFLPDGLVTHQTGWALDHVTETAAYQGKLKVPKIFKKGNYTTLIYYWGAGYYHWFKDVLCTLHEVLELIPKDTLFLLPAHAVRKCNEGNFYIKSLAALGIDRERVLEFDGSESWILENLWWQPPAVHPDDQTPGALRWMGKCVSDAVKVSLSAKPKRIYISRKIPFARVLVNENDLLPGLQEMGFQICLLEEMPFEEQVRLFRNAEVVLAPHGAGLINLIFSKPGTRVVEILARGHERRCYWTLCEELGHDYRFYLGEPEFPGRRGEPDIVVNSEQFSSALKKSIEYL